MLLRRTVRALLLTAVAAIACHPSIVRALLRTNPTLTLGPPSRARFARWVARFRDCDEILALVDGR